MYIHRVPFISEHYLKILISLSVLFLIFKVTGKVNDLFHCDGINLFQSDDIFLTRTGGGQW